MTHELISSQSLLEQAVQKINNERLEKESQEEAQKRVPELYDKVIALMGLKPKAPAENTSQPLGIFDKKLSPKERQKQMEDLVREASHDIWKSFNVTTVTFDVPVDEQSIKVYLQKGSRSSGFTRYVDHGFEVRVVGLDSMLRIENKNAAVLESVAHRHKPFDMHTPIGPGGDLGPVWKKNINMQEFDAYNTLLTRLSEPDVAREEHHSRP